MPAEITPGQNLLVSDPADDSTKELTPNAGNSLAVHDGSEVVLHDGSSGDPITLDKVQLFSSSFPSVAAFNSGGELGKFDADPSCLKKVLVSKDGSWTLEEFTASHCWKDVCEKTPTSFAGFVQRKDCEDNDHYCLVRFSLQGSNCIELTGSGTSLDPIVISPKISQDEGNCLECRSDGLYAPCSSYSGASDPVEEL